MKKYFSFAIIVSMILVASCRKDEFNPHSMGTAADPSSREELFGSIGPRMQYHMIDVASGGTFTTPQGTIVIIPANAFVDMSNNPVTSGNAIIAFKDIYKKSDMLLSGMATQIGYGYPLKSGGEFFIKASMNNVPLQLAPGKKISVEQPIVRTGTPDSAMNPFVVQPDSMQNAGWNWNPADSVTEVGSYYVFSLYEFESPADSGSWCNSDNSNYFSNYTQEQINIHEYTGDSIYTERDAFLVFTGISSMVHVYQGYVNPNEIDYPYYYAPDGLHATVVNVGMKNGELYACFTPITISAGLNVNVTLTHISLNDFKAQLNALN